MCNKLVVQIDKTKEMTQRRQHALSHVVSTKRCVRPLPRPCRILGPKFWSLGGPNLPGELVAFEDDSFNSLTGQRRGSI
jgi:hypothetical protein